MTPDTPADGALAESIAELLPCPFCGSTNVRLFSLDEDCEVVSCDDCNGQGGYFAAPDSTGPDEAIAAWSRRALIPRPAEPAQVAQDEGPQNRKLKTCKGCKHFVSEYWREPSGDGETYDSGTSADCTKAGRSISTYSGDEPAPPSWCPFLISAAQEGWE